MPLTGGLRAPRRGRPRIGSHVNVTLPAAHLDALDQIAAARGAKRQDVTHSPVAEYLWHHQAISGHGQATRK